MDPFDYLSATHDAALEEATAGVDSLWHERQTAEACTVAADFLPFLAGAESVGDYEERRTLSTGSLTERLSLRFPEAQIPTLVQAGLAYLDARVKPTVEARVAARVAQATTDAAAAAVASQIEAEAATARIEGVRSGMREHMQRTAYEQGFEDGVLGQVDFESLGLPAYHWGVKQGQRLINLSKKPGKVGDRILATAGPLDRSVAFSSLLTYPEFGALTSQEGSLIISDVLEDWDYAISTGATDMHAFIQSWVDTHGLPASPKFPEGRPPADHMRMGVGKHGSRTADRTGPTIDSAEGYEYTPAPEWVQNACKHRFEGGGVTALDPKNPGHYLHGVGNWWDGPSEVKDNGDHSLSYTNPYTGETDRFDEAGYWTSGELVSHKPWGSAYDDYTAAKREGKIAGSFRDFMNEDSGKTGTCKHCGTSIKQKAGGGWEKAEGGQGADICLSNKGTTKQYGGEHQPKRKTSRLANFTAPDGTERQGLPSVGDMVSAPSGWLDNEEIGSAKVISVDGPMGPWDAYRVMVDAQDGSHPFEMTMFKDSLGLTDEKFRNPTTSSLHMARVQQLVWQAASHDQDFSADEVDAQTLTGLIGKFVQIIFYNEHGVATDYETGRIRSVKVDGGEVHGNGVVFRTTEFEWQKEGMALGEYDNPEPFPVLATDVYSITRLEEPHDNAPMLFGWGLSASREDGIGPAYGPGYCDRCNTRLVRQPDGSHKHADSKRDDDHPAVNQSYPKPGEAGWETMMSSSLQPRAASYGDGDYIQQAVNKGMMMGMPEFTHPDAMLPDFAYVVMKPGPNGAVPTDRKTTDRAEANRWAQELLARTDWSPWDGTKMSHKPDSGQKCPSCGQHEVHRYDDNGGYQYCSNCDWSDHPERAHTGSQHTAGFFMCPKCHNSTNGFHPFNAPTCSRCGTKMQSEKDYINSGQADGARGISPVFAVDHSQVADLAIYHDAPYARCRNCGKEAIMSLHGHGPAVHKDTGSTLCEGATPGFKSKGSQHTAAAPSDHAVRYAEGLNAKHKDDGAWPGYNEYEATGGQRYDRIVMHHPDPQGNRPPHSGSVHAFVERETGHVYKADGWKKPAKGIRYHSVDDALKVSDPYGRYLYTRHGSKTATDTKCYACDGTGKATQGWSGRPGNGITCPDCKGTGIDQTPYGTGGDYCPYCMADWKQPHDEDCPSNGRYARLSIEVDAQPDYGNFRWALNSGHQTVAVGHAPTQAEAYQVLADYGRINPEPLAMKALLANHHASVDHGYLWHLTPVGLSIEAAFFSDTSVAPVSGPEDGPKAITVDHAKHQQARINEANETLKQRGAPTMAPTTPPKASEVTAGVYDNPENHQCEDDGSGKCEVCGQEIPEDLRDHEGSLYTRATVKRAVNEQAFGSERYQHLTETFPSTGWAGHDGFASDHSSPAHNRGIPDQRIMGWPSAWGQGAQRAPSEGSLHTASWIDAARQVLTDGFQTVRPSGEVLQTKWRNDDTPRSQGDAMLLDHFTASMLVQIYDALGPEQKAKFAAMPLDKAVDVGWKLVNKTRASKQGAFFNTDDNGSLDSNPSDGDGESGMGGSVPMSTRPQVSPAGDSGVAGDPTVDSMQADPAANMMAPTQPTGTTAYEQPTMAQRREAKIARMAKQIVADNPGVKQPDAERLARMTVAQFPGVVAEGERKEPVDKKSVCEHSGTRIHQQGRDGKCVYCKHPLTEQG